MANLKVISLGGSIIVPDQVDVPFVKNLFDTIVDYLEADENRKLIIVCGGGAPARQYQKALKDICDRPTDEALDWVGIAATRLNAELLKQLFWAYCPEKVIIDPSLVSVFAGRVLIAAGWKPGFSTDYDAVLLAEKFQADTLINLSNIAKVYTADPKKDKKALALDRVSWARFRELVGDTWVPGVNVPFDPVASRYAAKLGLRVIVASGRDMENLQKILADSDFEGTVIGGE